MCTVKNFMKPHKDLYFFKSRHTWHDLPLPNNAPSIPAKTMKCSFISKRQVDDNSNKKPQTSHHQTWRLETIHTARNMTATPDRYKPRYIQFITSTFTMKRTPDVLFKIIIPAILSTLCSAYAKYFFIMHRFVLQSLPVWTIAQLWLNYNTTKKIRKPDLTTLMTTWNGRLKLWFPMAKKS